jgi:hypothetical protein
MAAAAMPKLLVRKKSRRIELNAFIRTSSSNGMVQR